MKKSDKADKSQEAIDNNLKKVYQETLEEDIPDRFVSLLERLRQQEQATCEAEATDSPADEEVR